MIPAATPGRNASQRAVRNVPSHLPHTLARVEIGVDISTSRLPRTRSSASELGAWLLSRSMPSDDCNSIDVISTKFPAGVSIPNCIALAIPIPVPAIAPASTSPRGRAPAATDGCGATRARARGCRRATGQVPGRAISPASEDGRQGPPVQRAPERRRDPRIAGPIHPRRLDSAGSMERRKRAIVEPANPAEIASAPATKTATSMGRTYPGQE